jgi:ABC-2 type transport system permease protein
MARYFVRLKLRLILNALRSGRGAVGLVAGFLFAVPFVIAGFGIFAFAARDEVAWAREIAVVGFTLLFLGWVLLPVIGFGSDETLDPSRLALLPLTRSRMVAGLTAASCVGIPPLATLAVLSGTVVGYGRGAATAVVAAAVAVELLLCVVASRAVVTALSRRLRSRKSRDAIIVGVTLFALSLQAISFMQGNLPAAVSGAVVRRVAGVLAWTPPGLAGRAVAEAGDGRLPAALAALAAAAVCLPLLMAWWWRSLDHVLTTAEEQTVRRTDTKGEGLFPRPFGAALPRSRAGAVAARQLRSFWREPQLRVAWINAAMIGALFPGISVLNWSRRPSAVLFAAVTAAANALFVGANQFGNDGRAWWTHAVPDGARADLAGKNYALALVALPLVLLVAVVLSVFTGGWAYVPAALALSVAAVGIALGWAT